MFFLWKTMHPRIIRVTKDPMHNMFVNADAAEKPSCPQILHLSSDNAIYFANAEYTVEHILERLYEMESPVKFLLLDLHAMGFIDITGVDEMRSLIEEAKGKQVEIALMGVHTPVMETFKRSGFINDISADLIIKNRGDAITVLFNKIDHGYCKDKCPYVLFNECPEVKEKEQDGC
jgi:SulP family sulfate permease